MSTRRARIKAVTSLPPRRKNAVVAENKAKETVERTTKSPRTPLNEINSPRIENLNESKTLENIAQHNLIEKLITKEQPPSENTIIASTPIVPHTPEKLHSIDNKINSNVFVSPASSPRTTFVSSIAVSPASSPRTTFVSPIVVSPASSPRTTFVSPIVVSPASSPRTPFVSPIVVSLASSPRKTFVSPIVVSPASSPRTTFVSPIVVSPDSSPRTTFVSPIVVSPALSPRTTFVSPIVVSPDSSPRTTFVSPIVLSPASSPRTTFVSPIAVSPASSPRFVSPIAPLPNVNKSSDAESPNTPQSGAGAPAAHTISDNNELQISETIVNKVDDNVKSKEDNVRDDYSIPNVPESDYEIMDGIVPLKPAISANKRIQILKIEIISKNSEWMFDPIIPLPSPSTVPPKLHTDMRLPPLRRNIVQGSASESEDENRRSLLNSKDLKAHDVHTLLPLPNRCLLNSKDPQAHDVHTLQPLPNRCLHNSKDSQAHDVHTLQPLPNRCLLNSKDPQAHDVHTLQPLPNRDASRVRNDSVCSSVSPVAIPPVPPAAAASPVTKKQPKNKYTNNDMTRRREGTRGGRRKAMWQRPGDEMRDTLTMYDLISYNPTSNPLVLTEDEIIIDEVEDKQERKAEEQVAAATPAESPNMSAEAAPAPQIKLGPQGEIILDEQSLVIKQTESDRIVSSAGARGTGGQNRKQDRRAARWTEPETVRFYRALAAVGTDFTLMTELFPDRTRKQLKNKFKKEDKSNSAQIDKALSATEQFDLEELKEEFEEERALAANEAELERERERELLHSEMRAERERRKAARECGLRQSRASKAMQTSMVPFHPDAITVDDIIAHHTQQLQKSKQRRQKSKTLAAMKSKQPAPQKPPKLAAKKSKQPAPQKPPKLAAMKSKQPAPQKTPKLAAMAVVGSTSKPKEDTASNRTNTPSLQVIPPEAINTLQIPTDIETGSLVVISVDDPGSPGKKKLQTYRANGPGQLTPVALSPSTFNSVVGYMEKGTPIGSNVSSPLLSPSSVASIESYNSVPSGVTVLPSPAKRQRHSSYTITQI